MAGGWARDGAVEDQIDASVEDAVARVAGCRAARACSGARIAAARSPKGRREALRGVRLCVECQSERGRHDDTQAGTTVGAAGYARYGVLNSLSRLTATHG